MNAISAFNPFNNQYHALADFKKLTLTQRILTIALTALASIATAFIGTAAVFRSLVGHFLQVNKIAKPSNIALPHSGHSLPSFAKLTVAKTIHQPKSPSTHKKIEHTKQQWAPVGGAAPSTLGQQQSVSEKGEPKAATLEKASPVEAIGISDRLKACHVFISSGPFEGEHTGDTDYAEKIVGIMKDAKVNASYLTGSTVVGGKPLYNKKDISYEGVGDFKKIKDDDKRKEAANNVIAHILSVDGPKIFHLQLRTPETGCMFLPEDLEKLRENGVKVVITCHEWQLNNHRPHYQKQALEYFAKADEVIFLNLDDKDHAVQTTNNNFPSKVSVSAVPITVPIAKPTTPEEVVQRKKNILTFGMIRANKGFEQSIRLAREIKNSGQKDLTVVIAGKPSHFDYFITLAKPALALKDTDIAKLKEAWDKEALLRKYSYRECGGILRV